MRREVQARDSATRDVREKGRPARRDPAASEVVVRHKVKVIYLSLVIISIAVIVLFAILLKDKLKTIREFPDSSAGQQQFEEHPRITLSPIESTAENESQDIQESETETTNSHAQGE